MEEIYTPALNIRVRDNRSFGRRPIVGVHSVRSLQKYRCPTPQVTEEVDSGAKGPAPKGRDLYPAIINEGEAKKNNEQNKSDSVL